MQIFLEGGLQQSEIYCNAECYGQCCIDPEQDMRDLTKPRANFPHTILDDVDQYGSE